MTFDRWNLPVFGLRQWVSSFASGMAVVLACTSSLTWAETATVTVDGSSNYCYSKEQSSKLANINASNKGHAACRALGPDWRFSKALESGQEDCVPCKSANESRCKVTQASFECINRSRNSKQNSASGTSTFSRASDPSPEIACAEAKLMASKGGTPGDCSCEFKAGKRHVCTVQSSGLKSEPTIIQTLKAKLILEVEAWCKAHEPECRDPKHPNYIRLRSAATGVRG